MTIPSDVRSLLPPRQADYSSDRRPLEYLWVYDPQEAKVHVEAGETDHPAHFPTHRTMAEHITHPDRQQGYAYSIQGGWRINDEFGHKVEDPFVLKRILAALDQKEPAPPLPHIRYHGKP